MARTGRRIGRGAGRVFQALLLAVCSAAALYPVLWLVAVSFKSKEQYLAEKLFFSWPPHLETIVNAIRGGGFSCGSPTRSY